MRLADVHGALAAAYGRSAGPMTGKGRGERSAETSRDSARSVETGTASGNRMGEFTQGVEKFMQSLGVELKFHVHDTGEVQAEVRHPGGEKVIRKIPPDEILELADSIRRMSGAFLDKSF